METLGNRIKKYREVKGLTQRELADMIGVKHNSISDWENDKNIPHTERIQNLLWALEVDANTLLGWDTPEKLKENAEKLANLILNNPKIKETLPEIIALSDEDMEILKTFIKRLKK